MHHDWWSTSRLTSCAATISRLSRPSMAKADSSGYWLKGWYTTMHPILLRPSTALLPSRQSSRASHRIIIVSWVRDGSIRRLSAPFFVLTTNASPDDSKDPDIRASKGTLETAAECVDALQDGKIDAAFIVAGAPTTAVVDLASMKEINLVQLDEEHIAALQEDYNFYTETVIPAGTYKGLDEDATVVSVRATLVAYTGLSDEVV